MIPRSKILPWLLAAAVAAALLPCAAAPADLDFFEKRIRPVLSESCYECHSSSSKKLKGGLLVDSRENLIKGGESGTALIPGKPEESLLYKALAHSIKDMEMPPKKPRLSNAILADFEKWIHDGAPWPATPNVAATANSTPVANTAPSMREFDLGLRKARLPWIWEKPARPRLPDVRDKTWPANAIDHFILSRLEKEKLKPAVPTEPNLWLRRVYFTLTGLPPSVSELQQFLQDNSLQAREKVVDQLLASPRFGERWGRHWLDLVRYAESRGHESDYIIPNAYEYRDYVIRALNADLPYNQFITEHLAGDLLQSPRLNPHHGFNESILATGWAFLGEEIHAPVDTRLDETERMDNRIDVFSKTFLGLTVSCARCHDHKFDAISQKDYYALAGFFISTGQRLARFESIEGEKDSAKRLARLRENQRPRLATELANAKSPVLSKLRSYLLAASSLCANEPSAAAGKTIRKSELSATTQDSIARIAAENSLNREILASWTTALCNASTNSADALHPLNRLALGRSVASGEGRSWTPDLPPDSRVIIDYASIRPEEWLTDGPAFGLSPAKPGELRLIPGDTNRVPALRMITRASATFDPHWRNARLSPGVETEPTMYGSWKKDGATIRTPKFELKSGRLHYLVRGSGRIVAAVDSQRLITGPVHTILVREWPRKDAWTWYTHDLSDYKGHRVSVEFSPGSDFDTAVAMVVESESAPTAPATPGQHLASILNHRGATTVDAAAAAYQEIFQEAVDAMQSGKIDGNSCEIAGWMTSRPDLFSGEPGTWPDNLSKVIEKELARCENELRQVAWNSKTAPAMMEGNGVDEYLLVRGKHQTPKGLVPRRFLEAISGPDPIQSGSGSGRLELAKTLASPSNPLTARVFVNRVWHHVFGRGIVPTVDNFGWLGLRATHPELLDYLADSFVNEDSWSLKSLVKRMVLSSTFAQSSHPSDAASEELDPENSLLHRMNLKRLEAESIRDSILSASGRLDNRMYGPSIPLHPSQFVEARGLRSERGPLDGKGRRSVYVAARRNFLPMMMTAFDLPIPFTTVGRRNVSNVPGQMLFLMNDPFVHEQSEVWAHNLQSMIPPDDSRRIQYLYLTAFSREPSQIETARCLASLAETRALGIREGSPLDPWAELCHALIGVKEFIYVR